MQKTNFANCERDIGIANKVVETPECMVHIIMNWNNDKTSDYARQALYCRGEVYNYEATPLYV